MLAALACLTLPALLQGNVRVVDAVTGRPIAGAEVLAVREAQAPLPGPHEFFASRATDDDGWAELPLSTEEAPYTWRVVRAEGYAISGSMQVPRAGTEPATVELHRAGQAKLRVLDFRGRPVPDLYLGFCVGCGHTPDVASAVTDAGGHATLRCVGKTGRDIDDLYPVGAGVRTDYADVEWDAALEGGFETVVRPGASIRGRLLLADGSPAAGYRVGAPHLHRGPWTVVDDAGTFTLPGVDPYDPTEFQILTPTGDCPVHADRHPIAYSEGSHPGLPRTLRLPAEAHGDVDPLRDAAFTLRVHTSDPRIEELDLGAPGRVWDPVTGWCESFRVWTWEGEEVSLPAGAYELELGGGGSPFARVSLGTIEVTAGAEPLVVEHELAPIRTVRLEVSGLPPEPKAWTLTASGTSEELRFDQLADGLGVIETFPVPSEPFGLWLRVEEPGRYQVLLELEDDPRTSDLVRAHPRR